MLNLINSTLSAICSFRSSTYYCFLFNHLPLLYPRRERRGGWGGLPPTINPSRQFTHLRIAAAFQLASSSSSNTSFLTFVFSIPFSSAIQSFSVLYSTLILRLIHLMLCISLSVLLERRRTSHNVGFNHSCLLLTYLFLFQVLSSLLLHSHVLIDSFDAFSL